MERELIKTRLKEKVKIIENFQVMSQEMSQEFGINKPTPMITQGGNARKSELKSVVSLLK